MNTREGVREMGKEQKCLVEEVIEAVKWGLTQGVEKAKMTPEDALEKELVELLVRQGEKHLKVIAILDKVFACDVSKTAYPIFLDAFGKLSEENLQTKFEKIINQYLETS